MTKPTARTGERRRQIVGAAIEIIAAQGIRALTHRAVDARLELPAGSTSYYLRTKHALLEAVVHEIAARTTTDFAKAGMTSTAMATPDDAMLAVARWVDYLLLERGEHIAVRYALAIELSADPPLHEILATALFSQDRAVGLLEFLGAAEPRSAAADFVSLLEGLVFDRFAAARSLDGVPPGTPESVELLLRPIRTFVRGAAAG